VQGIFQASTTREQALAGHAPFVSRVNYLNKSERRS
jgi:hypothetical protein